MAVGASPVKILDVGCSTGFLGRLLANQGHLLVGIETDREAAAIATPFYESMHITSVENFTSSPGTQFEVIVMGDVLEHVIDPASVLRRLVSLVAPGGRILLSVPNVAFVGVRLALLAGRFEPVERGIMDRTHLHFFTRRKLLHLLDAVGVRSVRIQGIPPPVPLVVPALAGWPWRLIWEVINGLARAWPTMFAYQLFAEAVI